MPPTPAKASFLPRKLLVAAVGVATINYVGGTACGGKTDGSDDPKNNYPPTSGNLPAPTATPPPTSGNLPAPPDECPSTRPIDADVLPWRPPAVAPGSCTEGDLAALVSHIDMNPNGDPSAWKASIASEVCRSCIFGPEGVTWPPLVENNAGMLSLINVGGCIAVATGNAACGKAYQNWYDCRIEACIDCEDNGSRFAQCLSVANKSACKAAFDNVGTICGDVEIANAEQACVSSKYVFEGPVRAQCIGLGDGGAGGDGG
ncbi:MAG: hypothetical protein KF819_33780 [Labilithrix sp.]|nr:hypothetical protein [Labilithrix sp.]